MSLLRSDRKEYESGSETSVQVEVEITKYGASWNSDIATQVPGIVSNKRQMFTSKDTCQWTYFSPITVSLFHISCLQPHTSLLPT